MKSDQSDICLLLLSLEQWFTSFELEVAVGTIKLCFKGCSVHNTLLEVTQHYRYLLAFNEDFVCFELRTIKSSLSMLFFPDDNHTTSLICLTCFTLWMTHTQFFSQTWWHPFISYEGVILMQIITSVSHSVFLTLLPKYMDYAYISIKKIR